MGLRQNKKKILLASVGPLFGISAKAPPGFLISLSFEKFSKIGFDMAFCSVSIIGVRTRLRSFLQWGFE